MRFYKDKTGELENLFRKVMKKECPHLKILRYVYIWREGESLDDEGIPIAASVRKLPNRDRDVFHRDVAMEVDKDIWADLTKEARYKLAHHELLHLRLTFVEPPEDEDAVDLSDYEVKRDSNDRLSFYVENHDIVIKKFKKELAQYGLTKAENQIRKFLNSVHKAHKGKTFKRSKREK